MKLAIMQPYFFPYIGYFQLVNAVDEFVVYDNIKYTKKGWINRNRILSNNEDEFLTIPIKKGSDSLYIVERELSASFIKDKEKILRKVVETYRNAPYFSEAFQLFEQCLNYSETNNLFSFIYNSIKKILEYLEISTKLTISSQIEQGEANLKGQDRVLNICRIMNTDVYINPIGGMLLYNKQEFAEKGVSLKFIKTGNVEYCQLGDIFHPNLSILDVIMFNSVDNMSKHLKNYTLI